MRENKKVNRNLKVKRRDGKIIVRERERERKKEKAWRNYKIEKEKSKGTKIIRGKRGKKGINK